MVFNEEYHCLICKNWQFHQSIRGFPTKNQLPILNGIIFTLTSYELFEKTPKSHSS